MELEKIFSLVILGVSAWSALALLLDRRGQLEVNRYFAILLGVLCLSQIFIYATLVASPAAFIFGHIVLASIWLKGPLILQMVYLLLGQKHTLKTLAWQSSGFPIALGVTLLVPRTLMFWHLLGACLSLAILCWSGALLRRNRHRLAHLYAEFKNTAFFWLLFMVLGMLLLLGADIVLFASSLYFQAFPYLAGKVLTFAISLYVVAIAFFSIYRPDIFFRELHAERELQQSSGPDTLLVLAPSRNLELDDGLALALRQELERLMSSEFLYRQTDLSLMSFAQLLGISVHQVSELLNVHMGTQFYGYINGYRLQYAAEMLRDPRCQLRVLDIIFESGFNNKNSFYREFREMFGMTPGEYRSRQLCGLYGAV